MALTLTIYTALWTHEDVAFGANDPEKTTEEMFTFRSPKQLIAWLVEQKMTEPSSYPVTGNETRVWFSEKSRFIAPGEELDDRHERSAHRGPDVSDEVWTEIVRTIAA